MKCFLWKHDWEEVDRQIYIEEASTYLFPNPSEKPITIITFRCKNHIDKLKQVRLDGHIKK